MARGRHRRRTGFLWTVARLWRREPRLPVRSEVELLGAEVARLRDLVELSARTTSRALVRAARAEDHAVGAGERAARAEQRLAAVQAELAALRAGLSGVREELVWAFAEGRGPVATGSVARPADHGAVVVDLRPGAFQTG
jgi:hypothetical protein